MDNSLAKHFHNIFTFKTIKEKDVSSSNFDLVMSIFYVIFQNLNIHIIISLTMASCAKNKSNIILK